MGNKCFVRYGRWVIWLVVGLSVCSASGCKKKKSDCVTFPVKSLPSSNSGLKFNSPMKGVLIFNVSKAKKSFLAKLPETKKLLKKVLDNKVFQTFMSGCAVGLLKKVKTVRVGIPRIDGAKGYGDVLQNGAIVVTGGFDSKKALGCIKSNLQKSAFKAHFKTTKIKGLSGLIIKHPETGSSAHYVLATSDSSLAWAPSRYAKADLLRHPHFKSAGAAKISKAMGKNVLLWSVSGEFNRGTSSLGGKLPIELKSFLSIQTMVLLLDVGKKSMSFVVHLITKDTKSAEKLKKAIKKGVEMMSMIGAMEKEKDKEDKLFMELVGKIKFKKMGTSVQVGLNIPKSLAVEIVKEIGK